MSTKIEPSAAPAKSRAKKSAATSRATKSPVLPDPDQQASDVSVQQVAEVRPEPKISVAPPEAPASSSAEARPVEGRSFAPDIRITADARPVSRSGGGFAVFLSLAALATAVAALPPVYPRAVELGERHLLPLVPPSFVAFVETRFGGSFTAISTPGPDMRTADSSARMELLERRVAALAVRVERPSDAPAAGAAVDARIAALETRLSASGTTAGQTDAAAAERRAAALDARLAGLERSVAAASEAAAADRRATASLLERDAQALKALQAGAGEAQMNAKRLAAVLALRGAVLDGRPFTTELEWVRMLHDDDVTRAAVDFLTPYGKRGVAPLADLRDALDKSEFIDAVRQAADDASLMARANRYTTGWLADVGLTRKPDPSPTDTLLDEARSAMAQGRLPEALNFVLELRGIAGTLMSPWVSRAKARLLVDEITQRLLQTAVQKN